MLHFSLLGLLIAACQPADSPGPSDPTARNLGPQDEAFVEATAAEHVGDVPTASPMAEAELTRPLLEQELAYGEAQGENLTGFLAMPEDAAEPLPGLVVIHEWWGLNDNIKAMTRRLAAEGYVALAVDLYGGRVAEDTSGAQALMAEIVSEPDVVRANLRQAYDYLDRYAFAPSVGSIGWCLGGGWSLQTALMLPDQLDAMVMYYGRVVTDEELLEPLRMPMLGHFGEQDASIPIRDVQNFRNMLARQNKQAQIHIYSGADHAFANPSGGNYSPVAATESWDRTIEFLNANLARSDLATPGL
jgi:carboxymethylenebutenolidase